MPSYLAGSRGVLAWAGTAGASSTHQRCLWGLCLPQVKSLGRGCYGEAMLMRDRTTGLLVAIKYIEKGKVGVRSGCEQGRTAAHRPPTRLCHPCTGRNLRPLHVGMWAPCFMVQRMHFLCPHPPLQVDEYVQKEIRNHVQLTGHPNIIQFKEVRHTCARCRCCACPCRRHPACCAPWEAWRLAPPRN